MSDANPQHQQDAEAPAQPADTAADARRRRQLRVAAAVEARYLLTLRAA